MTWQSVCSPAWVITRWRKQAYDTIKSLSTSSNFWRTRGGHKLNVLVWLSLNAAKHHPVTAPPIFVFFLKAGSIKAQGPSSLSLFHRQQCSRHKLGKDRVHKVGEQLKQPTSQEWEHACLCSCLCYKNRDSNPHQIVLADDVHCEGLKTTCTANSAASASPC